MRVLHVGKFYHPYLGGMESALKSLCEGKVGPVTTEVLVANVNRHSVVERVGPVNVTRAGMLGLISSIPFCPSFPYWMRKRVADIICLHEPNPMALLSHVLVRPRGRLVVWFHSEIVGRPWFYWLYRPFLEATLRRASRIVVTSPRQLDHIPVLAAVREKCTVIPWGIDLSRFEKTPDVLDKAAAIRQGAADPLVLFVGRLTYYKGVEYLIEAMEHVRGTLLVVGGGPGAAAFEDLVNRRGLQSRVRFVGQVPDEDLPAYYHACDVFVLPSVERSEAFGIVQLEAMACSKPVVSTNLPTGVPWVNRHGETGIVVEPRSASALADSINELLTDPDRRERYGSAARLRVEREFTEQHMHACLAMLYREVLHDRRVPTTITKRTLDVMLSGLGLIISSPLWLFVAALIKLDDGGPIFYPQVRAGRGGQPFTVFKFRSMRVGTADGDALAQATEDDPRVTRVGRLLRATGMDELPQLVNIFIGDMSFVGPRALVPEEIEVDGDGTAVPVQDIPGYGDRAAVAPGLTGLAQIYARRDVPRRWKFRIDKLYVARQNLWLDLRLIALSFWISLRGTWEVRGRKF